MGSRGKSVPPGWRFRDCKREAVEFFEQQYLNRLLVYHQGNVSQAARKAGLQRSALQRLMRKHGIKSDRYRQAVSA